MKTVVIGIDPGSNGGFGVWYPRSKRLVLTPVNTSSEGDLLDYLKEAQNLASNEDWRIQVYMERVTGFIGKANRGSHMFKFGRCFDYPIGVCRGLGIPITLVEPAKWQDWAGVPKSFPDLPKPKWYDARKKAIVKIARDTLPTAERLINDTADAAMITAYGLTLSA